MGKKVIFTERVHRFLRRIARAYLDEQVTADTPNHYDSLITQFANAYPHATRSDWRHFTLTMAAQAFGDGFELGVEHQEPIDESQPERVADQMDRDWRDREPIDLDNPDVIVLEELPSEGIMTDDFLRRMTR